ncbi:MAG: aldo/keto reductase, partial [Chloroflexi bacterium]|nr:aldo/keto reductase [Chloroflexota bacterium]
MQQRKLGRTGLAVTRMGLGLAALGRPGYINLDHADALNHNYEVDAMRAHTHTVLDAAWVAGIRYFDAARSYGRAEEFLASWLVARGIAPVNATIGSKWGYTYTADWQVDAEVHEVKEHSLDVLTRQRQETHQNLGQHLDLYQVHSATLSSGIFERTEVLEELARMRDAGLGIGLSLSGPGQPEALRRAMAIEIGGEPVFAT